MSNPPAYALLPVQCLRSCGQLLYPATVDGNGELKKRQRTVESQRSLAGGQPCPLLLLSILACCMEALKGARRNTASSVPVPRPAQTADAAVVCAGSGARGTVPEALHGVSPSPVI